MHEHAAHLGRLVGPAQPAAQPLVGAAAGAGARQHRGEVAGGEADQRIAGRQRRHHDFAHLALGHRLAAAGAHDLDDDALVHHQALARCGLVGDQAQVGRRIALVGIDAALGKPGHQRRRAGLAADQGALQIGQRPASLGRLLQQDAQQAGRARIGLGLQVQQGLQLQLGIADPAGKAGRPEGAQAGFHHGARRGQVIAEAHMGQLAGTDARRMQGTRDAPGVGAVGIGFGLVQRARRLEDAPRYAGRKTAQAQRAARGLGRSQAALAGQRQLGERGAAGDGRGIDARQQLRVGRAAGLGMGDLGRQCRHQRRFPLHRVARLQRVVKRVAVHRSSFQRNRRRLISSCRRRASGADLSVKASHSGERAGRLASRAWIVAPSSASVSTACPASSQPSLRSASPWSRAKRLSVCSVASALKGGGVMSQASSLMPATSSFACSSSHP
mmetsp:Transcript_1047/g.2754  ORF Transcript_1047/g.2754 Transcript_1047/m.2754 type:complete len:443 (+) Transcript_1047:656-1984(+)